MEPQEWAGGAALLSRLPWAVRGSVERRHGFDRRSWADSRALLREGQVLAEAPGAPTVNAEPRRHPFPSGHSNGN